MDNKFAFGEGFINRKTGESIKHEENSPRLSQERALKVFEALLVLNRNTDPKEMAWYRQEKQKYADTYLGGVAPDMLINSIDDAKKVLYEVTGQDFTQDFARFDKYTISTIETPRSGEPTPFDVPGGQNKDPLDDIDISELKEVAENGLDEKSKTPKVDPIEIFK